MKKANTALSVLASESGELNRRTAINVSPPIDKSNIFGPPSLGNHYRDVRNLAMLLQNMKSGMDTYHRVFDALHSEYGADFKTEFLREVSR